MTPRDRRRKVLLGLAAALLAAPRALAKEPAPPGRDTLKQRLSDKASDEQRVNNCKVPPEKRGPKPRPGCPDGQAQPEPAGKR
jgi:hypothetical protein